MGSIVGHGEDVTLAETDGQTRFLERLDAARAPLNDVQPVTAGCLLQDGPWSFEVGVSTDHTLQTKEGKNVDSRLEFERRHVAATPWMPGARRLGRLDKIEGRTINDFLSRSALA
jgi:hypothetical protein